VTGDAVLQEQIQRAQTRISALHKRVQSGGASAEPLLDESVAEMSVMLEELRQQSEELAEAYSIIEAERQRYQQLFNLAPDAYLVTDLEGVIREANQAAGRLLQVNQGALSGKPLVVFVPDAERRAFRSRFRRVLDNAPHPEWELRIQPRGGEPIEVAITTTAALGPNGDAVGLRWLIRDITERKRAEDMVRHLSRSAGGQGSGGGGATARHAARRGEPGACLGARL
jgi:PAS domain S-box-containing protein